VLRMSRICSAGFRILHLEAEHVHGMTDNLERFSIAMQRKQRNACLTFTRSTWYPATCQSPFQENLEASEWAMRDSITTTDHFFGSAPESHIPSSTTHAASLPPAMWRHCYTHREPGGRTVPRRH